MNKNLKLIMTLFVVVVFAWMAIASSDKSKDADKKLNSEGKSSTATNMVPVGTKTTCGSFDVTIHSFKLQNSVNTGNTFLDLKPEEGTKYAIIDIEFVNVTKQAAMISEGSLIIKPVDDEPLVMDKSETLMADGWGLFLDSINPMLKKRTKLVFKVPSAFKGDIYYDPEMGDNVLFSLGQM